MKVLNNEIVMSIRDKEQLAVITMDMPQISWDWVINNLTLEERIKLFKHMLKEKDWELPFDHAYLEKVIQAPIPVR